MPPEPGAPGAKILRLPRRTRDAREFLPAALEIIETPSSPVGRAIGATIVAAALFALLWASIGRVDIVATASGRIVPVGRTKIVQPMETSVVGALHVGDGDHVRRGDVLVDLDAVAILADRDRYARDLRSARLDAAVLRGLEAAPDGGTPSLVAAPADALPEEAARARQAMVARAAGETAKLAELDAEAAEKTAEAEEAEASSAKLAASLPMVAAEERLRHQLLGVQFGNQLAWYEAERTLVEQQHDILVLAKHRQGAEAAAKALIDERAADAAEYRVTLAADLDKAEAEAREAAAELAKARERLRLAVLRAPIDGTVQQVAVHTVGGVVTPAEQLMVIVPDRDGLVVEAMVENRDVGFVHPGQRARIKIDTFNFTRYGLIDGTVLGLSHDAIAPGDAARQDETPGDGPAKPADSDPASHEPAYMARISLARDWMETEAGRIPLAPGMAVTVEIQTGRRRIIDYLLSPLAKHVEESLHER